MNVYIVFLNLYNVVYWLMLVLSFIFNFNFVLFGVCWVYICFCNVIFGFCFFVFWSFVFWSICLCVFLGLFYLFVKFFERDLGVGSFGDGVLMWKWEILVSGCDFFLEELVWVMNWSDFGFDLYVDDKFLYIFVCMSVILGFIGGSVLKVVRD